MLVALRLIASAAPAIAEVSVPAAPGHSAPEHRSELGALEKENDSH